MHNFITEDEWELRMLDSGHSINDVCPECDGIPHTRCVYCNGTGLINCYACDYHDKSQDLSGEDCYCESGLLDCGECDGFVYIACETCKGGYVNTYEQQVEYDRITLERHKVGMFLYSPHEVGEMY